MAGDVTTDEQQLRAFLEQALEVLKAWPMVDREQVRRARQAGYEAMHIFERLFRDVDDLK